MRAKFAAKTPTSRVVRCANTAESAKKTAAMNAATIGEGRLSGGARRMSRKAASAFPLALRLVYLQRATAMPSDPHQLLEKYFGFREFLDAQEEVITTILAGNDALVVMPTGGGKSLCYQLPALMLDGVTVVVSPLIALMKDQVDALERRGIAGDADQQLAFAGGTAGAHPPSGCRRVQARLHRPGAVSQPVVPGCARAGRRFRSSPSTRHTASRNGATISGRITSAWARCSKSSAVRRSPPSPPRPRRRCAGTSSPNSDCRSRGNSSPGSPGRTCV